jgi:hypothetical protein
MKVVRTLVVLASYGDHGTIHRPLDAVWFQDYFFNPIHGHKAYWLKQTDNEIVLEGRVVGWHHYGFGSFDVTKRSDIATKVMLDLRDNLGMDMNMVDLPIVVLGIAPHVPSDGGSGHAVLSPERTLRSVVTRIGDRWDFIAHEIGHGLGLEHSFGNDWVPVIGDHPGGYGHPHCIMSAMRYGGLPGGGPHFPAQPRDGRPECTPLGPSLGAVPVVRYGWVHKHVFSGPATREYRLRSRNHGGRAAAGLAPQAILVNGAQGATYVVEYRERMGWDLGQDRDYLIVAQDAKGRADLHYPGEPRGTYLARLGLPPEPGQSWLDLPGFGIQLMSIDTAEHTLVLRLHAGGVPRLAVAASTELVVVRSVVLEKGVQDFAPGVIRCVQGHHPWVKREEVQQAVFEATWTPGEAITAHWTIWGEPVPANGEVTRFMKVSLPSPQLVSFTDHRNVSIDCRIDSLPNGTRMTITNRPENGTIGIEAKLTLSGQASMTVETFSASLAGIVFDFGEAFEERRLRCLVDLSNPADRFPTYEVEIAFDAWRDIPRPKHREALQLLDLLAVLRDRGDETEFDRARADLAGLAGREMIDLTIVRLDDRIDVAEISRRPLPKCSPRPG